MRPSSVPGPESSVLTLTSESSYGNRGAEFLQDPYILRMLLERVELAWRRLWIRALVRLMRAPETAAPVWSSRPHRVLFLRHDRAGDMFLSTGVMRAIAQSHSTVTLDVLASP